MTNTQLSEIEARLRAAHVPGSGKMREFLENAPADMAALIAEVKILTSLNEHATSERERLAADVARFCENGRAVEAQLEAVTRELQKWKP